MMKKKVFSALILLCLVLCTIPMAGTAFADDTHGGGAHCICGGNLATCSSSDEPGHNSLAWTEWSNTSSLPGTGGNYYITGEITLNGAWEAPAGSTVICLNGHNINLNGNTITVKGSSRNSTTCELTITDCNKSTQGSIVSTGATAVEIGEKATFNMYGGTISGATGGTSQKDPAVKVSSQSGVFNMYGGKLSGNTPNQGAVVYNLGTFNMRYASEISGNGDTSEMNLLGGSVPQVIVNNAGTFNMSDNSKIRQNNIAGRCVNNQPESSSGKVEFTMTGGEISNNKGNEHFIYVGGSNSKFTMSGGKISDNSSNMNMLNHLVYVELGNNFEMSGTAEISNNKTKYTVANNYCGNFNMTGGKITGNEMTGGQSEGDLTPAVIYNEGDTDNDHTATFKMSGGEISNNTVANGSKGSTVFLKDSKVKFTMSGSAVIKGNKALNGAGVYNNGTFDMNGGSIIDNSAEENGGGVYNAETGAFTLGGGSIKENHAVDGGGVYNKGIILLTGGTVGGGSQDGNVASGNGGGIYYAGGELTFSGNVAVKNNKKLDTPATTHKDNNLYIAKDKKLKLESSASLTDDNIGITLASDYGTLPATFATANDTDATKQNEVTTKYKEVFFSDNSDYKVGQTKTGDALQLRSATHKITYNLGSGADTSFNNDVSAPATYKEGDETTLPDGNSVQRSAYTFLGWYRSEDLSGEPVTSVGLNDTEDISLYAAWKPNSPTISVTSPNHETMTYGDNDKSFTVSLNNAEAYTAEYQWYENKNYSTSGGTAISETSATYKIPSSTNAGTYYYYCVITAKSSSKQEIVTLPSDVARLTVNKKKLEITGTAKAAENLRYSASKKADGTYEVESQNLLESSNLSIVGDIEGTIQYAVTITGSQPYDGSAWSGDLPTATDAGTYYVWYKAVPKDMTNYAESDVCTVPVKVEIAKATYTGKKTAEGSAVYDNSGEIDLTALIVPDGEASINDVTDEADPDRILGKAWIEENKDYNSNVTDKNWKYKVKFTIVNYNSGENAVNATTCKIKVTSKNYDDYEINVTIRALDKKTQSITVIDKYQNGTVTFDSESGKYRAEYEYTGEYSYSDEGYGITATATGEAGGTAGDISYKVTSQNDVLFIDENTGKISDILGIGTETITVTAGGNNDYKEATITVEITIKKRTQQLNSMTSPTPAASLIYTGEKHTLITDAKHGIIAPLTGRLLFSLGTDKVPYDEENNPASYADFDYGFKEAIPEATEAGTYYVWYKAGGDDYTEESKPCTIPVTVTIAKRTPTEAAAETAGKHEYIKPTGLTAVSGSKLSGIALTNPVGGLAGTWEWMTPDSSVDEASETPKTFMAKFIPQDTTNYETVENIELSVTVTKKTSSGSASSSSYVQNPTIILDGSEITVAGEDGISLIKNKQGTVELSKDGKTATIEPSEGYEVASVTVNGTEKGAVTTLTGLRTGDKVVVTLKQTADAQEKAETAKLNALLEKISLTARSSKTAKGNIKVTLKVNEEGKTAIKSLKDLGYTVKYKYYRSTKKASKYVGKITKTTKTYTNTKGTKGIKYYYKARVQVYDANGKMIAQTTLKQCKYACRQWSK